MSADSLFLVVNMAVLPAWTLLILLPRWRYSQTMAFGVTVPLLALLYGTLMVRLMTESGAVEWPDFSTLESTMAMLGDPYGFVAAWTHYLAFDLFVGAWMARDARANSVPHLLIVLPLLLTFFAGPLGLIIYLVMRQARRGEFLAEPSPFSGVLAHTRDA